MSGASGTVPAEINLSKCVLCHEKPCTMALMPCGPCADLHACRERETSVFIGIHFSNATRLRSRSHVCVRRLRKDLRAEVVSHPALRGSGGERRGHQRRRHPTRMNRKEVTDK